MITRFLVEFKINALHAQNSANIYYYYLFIFEKVPGPLWSCRYRAPAQAPGPSIGLGLFRIRVKLWHIQQRRVILSHHSSRGKIEHILSTYNKANERKQSEPPVRRTTILALASPLSNLSAKITVFFKSGRKMGVLSFRGPRCHAQSGPHRFGSRHFGRVGIARRYL